MEAGSDVKARHLCPATPPHPSLFFGGDGKGWSVAVGSLSETGARLQSPSLSKHTGQVRLSHASGEIISFRRAGDGASCCSHPGALAANTPFLSMATSLSGSRTTTHRDVLKYKVEKTLGGSRGKRYNFPSHPQPCWRRRGARCGMDGYPQSTLLMATVDSDVAEPRGSQRAPQDSQARPDLTSLTPLTRPSHLRRVSCSGTAHTPALPSGHWRFWKDARLPLTSPVSGLLRQRLSRDICHQSTASSSARSPWAG